MVAGGEGVEGGEDAGDGGDAVEVAAAFPGGDVAADAAGEGCVGGGVEVVEHGVEDGGGVVAALGGLAGGGGPEGEEGEIALAGEGDDAGAHDWEGLRTKD